MEMEKINKLVHWLVVIMVAPSCGRRVCGPAPVVYRAHIRWSSRIHRINYESMRPAAVCRTSADGGGVCVWTCQLSCWHIVAGELAADSGAALVRHQGEPGRLGAGTHCCRRARIRLWPGALGRPTRLLAPGTKRSSAPLLASVLVRWVAPCRPWASSLTRPAAL